MDGISAEQLHTLLRWFKEGPPGSIPISKDDRSLGCLQAVTWEDAGDSTRLEQLGRWHESAFSWFPDPFPVTPASARHWLVEQVLQRPDRILFWVKDVAGQLIGHVGLSRFDLKQSSVSVSDAVAAHPRFELLLGAGMETLTRWAGTMLHLQAKSQSRPRAMAA